MLLSPRGTGPFAFQNDLGANSVGFKIFISTLVMMPPAVDTWILSIPEVGNLSIRKTTLRLREAGGRMVESPSETRLSL